MGAYLAYPNKKTSPQRMSRKRLRNDVFMKNRKATKRAKAARLELRLQREVEVSLRDE